MQVADAEALLWDDETVARCKAVLRGAEDKGATAFTAEGVCDVAFFLELCGLGKRLGGDYVFSVIRHFDCQELMGYRMKLVYAISFS
jgi:hypothetical protein